MLMRRQSSLWIDVPFPPSALERTISALDHCLKDEFHETNHLPWRQAGPYTLALKTPGTTTVCGALHLFFPEVSAA